MSKRHGKKIRRHGMSEFFSNREDSNALVSCSPPNSPDSGSSFSVDFSFVDSADTDVSGGNVDDSDLDDPSFFGFFWPFDIQKW